MSVKSPEAGALQCVGRVGKAVYAGLLLLLFLAAFGLPSLAKYRDHKTILVRRPAAEQEVPAPAITFSYFPYNSSGNTSQEAKEAALLQELLQLQSCLADPAPLQCLDNRNATDIVKESTSMLTKILFICLFNK